MIGCINRNSSEYQHLKEVSGISEFQLDAICSDYLERFNRFPRLDELPSSNSSTYIKNQLKLDKNNSTSIQNILETLNVNSIEEATIKLNRIYNDSEVKIIPIIDNAIVEIKKRPSEDFKYIETPNEVNKNINSQMMITEALDKLANLYGIRVNQITDEEVDSIEGITEKDKFANAFIYNGEIYINIDRYSPDSFIHEMLHLLVGSMRFSNPQIYSSLIQSVENFENYPQLIRRFNGKSRNDANEELFVSQLARYLSGMPSQFTDLTEEQIYEINYNVIRVLDSILMGDFSSKIIEDLYNSTLHEVVKATNSNILSIKFSPEDSALHRKLANLKEDLIKKGELIETCD